MFAGAILGFFVGATIHHYEYASARLARHDFKSYHDVLKIADARYMNVFRGLRPHPDSTDQFANEWSRATKWIHWMARGATETIPASEAPDCPRYANYTQQLAYVRSAQFKREYGEINAKVTLNGKLRVIFVTAFLVSNADNPVNKTDGQGNMRWYSPNWRHVSAQKCGTSLIKVDITDPNPGERLLLFIQVEPTSSCFADEDRIVPDNFMEVT